MTFRSTLLAAGAALALAGPAAAQEAATAPDDSWVAVSGEVETAGLDQFTLDYGEGLITVVMDRYDWDADAAPLTRGDDVTVYGVVDDDFWEVREIEAASVYNSDTGEFHYAAVTEDDAFDWSYTGFSHVYDPDWDDSAITVIGTVLLEEAEGDEFFLDLGYHTMEVDTAAMAVDPLDEDGVRDVDAGDRVMVTGVIDNDLFDNAELSAETLLVLDDRS
ncbi:MAG: NirD/YgiW/YdeI family stress tolerance protein [Oceanicaulis sp.]